jgi:D-aspartate ligase
MLADLRAADPGTPAVVLKCDPNPLHHGALGVIRSLGRLGVPAYAVQEGQWAPAAHSRYLAGRVSWLPRPDFPQRLLTGLLTLAERIGRPAVLIPTDDAGAIFLAEQGDPLRACYQFPQPPPDLPRRLADKYSLFRLCRELEIPTPRARLAASPEEAAAFAAEVGYPVIAKLAAPWRQAAGPAAAGPAGPALRSTMIVGGPGELAAVGQRCAGAGLGLMLQEYIPPAPGQDWFFHGYCDAGSRCLAAFTGVKDRSYPAHAGLTSLGRAVPNGRLAGQAIAMAQRLHWRGVLDLDLRRDPRDGQYKLLDFNPRLGAQFRLFTDPAGVDLARAAYLDLTGQPVLAGEAVPGRRFLAENYDPLAALAYWRAGELGLAAWAASVRKADEAAWFARDDLLPFGLMCLRMGWRAASRRWARGPSVPPCAAGGPRLTPGRAARTGRWRAGLGRGQRTGPGLARSAGSTAGPEKVGVRA